LVPLAIAGAPSRTLKHRPGSRGQLTVYAVAATRSTEGEAVKNEIHPQYVETTVSCTCGSTFTTRSTAKSGSIHAEVCSNCHPFYTGKQKILDTGGRVAKFEKRFGKKA